MSTPTTLLITLHYTGHPFVDWGLATTLAFTHARRESGRTLRGVQDLTHEDLVAFAKYLADIYTAYPTLTKALSTYFLNAPIAQANVMPATREAYAHNTLFAFQQDQLASEGDITCAYFPELRALGAVSRQQVPLLNGRDAINFGAYGRPGLGISGLALLLIHASFLGCWKVGNYLLFHQLAVPGDVKSTQMMEVLAREGLETNADAIARMTPSVLADGMPSKGRSHRTRYIEALLEARTQLERREARLDNITGYWFTNYGPDPKMDILALTGDVLTFVDLASTDYPDAWARAANAHWLREKQDMALPPTDERRRQWRNHVYEGLFKLPQQAIAYLSLLAKARHWGLIDLFLREVLHMEPERIATYKRLGDKLAEYAMTLNQPHSFYNQFSRTKTYADMRARLLTASQTMLKRKEVAQVEPLFTYDEFILAFEHPSEGYSNWKLGRDLISFRMIELLIQANAIDPSEIDDTPMPTDDTQSEED